MKTITKIMAAVSGLLLSQAGQAQCQAGFTYTVGTAGQVSFTNTSVNTNTATTFYWNYGDGSSSTGPNASHNYLYNGSYFVWLNITDSLNGGSSCSSSFMDTVVITNAATCNLSVNFTYTLGSNGAVSFGNISTGVNSNFIINWNFGDGNTSSQSSPNYAYTYNGTYPVTLHISDSAGVCVGSKTDSLVITTAQAAPTCNVSFTYTLGSSGQVDFTPVYSGSLSNPSIVFATGDGNYLYTGLGLASYTYAYNGVYNAYISVTDSLNPQYSCYYQAPITITNTINNPNNCQDSVFFNLYRDSLQAGLWYAYTYSMNGNSLANATWNWGDGTTSSGLTPSHTYANPGWYTICVTGYLSCGDSTYYCFTDSLYRTNQMISVQVINGTNGISSNTKTMTSLNAYPNPFADNLTIKVTSYENKNIVCAMYDMMGNLVLKEEVMMKRGDNEVKLNTSSLNHGVYFVNVGGNGKTSTIKVVK